MAAGHASRSQLQSQPTNPTSGILGLDRDNDATTLLCRRASNIDIDDLAVHSTMSTYAPSTSTASSRSRSGSRIFTASVEGSTNPTSGHTGYSYAGKGVAIINRTPSLLASRGSDAGTAAGSAAEAEKGLALSCVGSWADPELEPRRYAVQRRGDEARRKKPEVVVHDSRLRLRGGAPDGFAAEPETGTDTNMPSRNDVANIEAGLGGQQRQRAVDNRLVVPPGVRAWSVVIILLFVVSVLFEFAGLIYLVMKEDSNPFLVRKQALFTLMTVLSGTVIVMITIGQALRDILHVLLLEALIYPIVLFHLLDFQGLLFP